MDELELISYFATCGACVLIEELNKKPPVKRRIWAKNWLLERQKKGAYNGILNELRLTDKEDFRKYLRMNTETFQVRYDIQASYFNILN